MYVSPLAVYVHWPFCKSKCPYCDFNSHVRERVEHAQWKEALLRELGHYAARVGKRQVGSIFFGGGTPSLMEPATAQAVIDAVAKHFSLSPDAEITLEANPTSVEAARFAGFAAAGVNRVSLGVQALNGPDLAFLGREHNADEAIAAIGLAARHFPRYSFDLIYARPGQTVAQWEAELQQALAMAGGHLSLYQLTIEEGTAFHHAYAQQKFTMPDEETSATLYELTQELCEAHGLPAYEVSNHAHPGAESRHNLAYWRSEDYLGIGAGAHGRFVPEGSAQRVATRHLKGPERWLEKVQSSGCGVEEEEVLTSEQRREEWVMMGLRLTTGLRKEDAMAKTGLPFDELIAPEKRNKLIKNNLLEENEQILRCTPQGRLVLTTLTGELLA